MLLSLKKQLIEITYYQSKLMEIDNYSEDIYQAYQRLIEELEYAIEELEG